MGWGYIYGNHSTEIARRVMADDFSIPNSKHPATQSFQAQYQAARERYWAAFS